MTGPAGSPGAGAATKLTPPSNQQQEAAHSTGANTAGQNKAGFHSLNEVLALHNKQGHEALELAAAISSSSIGTNSSDLDPKGHQHTALLAPIPPEKQLNLRWERICAFVSTDYDEASLLTQTLQRCRGQEVVREKKQVGEQGSEGINLLCVHACTFALGAVSQAGSSRLWV